MFSNLGPLFKTTFRQAESNDTRQKIPHDERDKGRKKRDEENKKEEKKDFWEESPSVSVGALRAFLINFLKTLPGSEDSAFIQNNQINSPATTRPHEKIRPTNTHNAKAVRAYQSMAEKTSPPKPKTPPPTNDRNKRIEPTADLLQSDELRDIHKLIEDLDLLAARGIDSLSIQQADDFVKSLKNAVRLALSK